MILPAPSTVPDRGTHNTVSKTADPVRRSCLNRVGAFCNPAHVSKRTRTEALNLRASVKLPPYDPQSTSASRLPLGVRNMPDAHQIIAYLSELSFQYAQNPAVRTATIQILHHFGTGNNATDSNVRILTDWVKDHVVYVPDPEDAEYIIAPPVMIRNIEEAGRTYGDCDDHVLLLASMLKAVGIPTKVVGVSLNSPNRYDHVIVSARVHGQWRDIDACAKDWTQPVYLKRLEPN